MRGCPHGTSTAPSAVCSLRSDVASQVCAAPVEGSRAHSNKTRFSMGFCGKPQVRFTNIDHENARRCLSDVLLLRALMHAGRRGSDPRGGSVGFNSSCVVQEKRTAAVVGDLRSGRPPAETGLLLHLQYIQARWESVRLVRCCHEGDACALHLVCFNLASNTIACALVAFSQSSGWS